MKKIWIVAALAACAIALAGCKIVSDPEPDPIAVQSVTLNETSLTLEYGETRTLTATVLPLNADNRRVTWSSSNTDVVWVTYDGTITAYNEGTAIIIAQAGDKIATCTVTVKRQPVSANWITLNETSLILRRNESRILTVTVHPENADDKLATWTSSDTGVATVDNNGIVTAVAQGTAIITARVGGVTGLCTVYVNEEYVEQPDYPGEVESVTLNTEKLMLAPGSTGTLVATVHPDDAIDKTVIWRAFNPYIATVDDDGTVTAVSEGSTFITAIVGGKTAECEVIVERISVPVEGITLDHETLTINRREEGKLTAMVTPSNADCTTVIWTSSNDEIAFVDYRDGIVVARNVGTVTITATTQEGGFTATCEVTVNPRPIENITFDKTTLALAPGETGELQYTLMLDDLDYNDDRTVILSSSDETIATVSRLSSYDKSKITALKLGKATITATAQAGGKTATCEVIVHNHSFTDGKCTVCGKNPSMKDGYIDKNGVLWKYTGMWRSVNIPEGVTGISGYKDYNYSSAPYRGAFEEYDSYSHYLTSVNIPDSVTSIGERAFYGCYELTSMTIGSGLTSIGDKAFSGCSLAEIKFNGTKAQWNAIKGSDSIIVTSIICNDGYIGIENIPEYLKMRGSKVTGYYADKVPSSVVVPDGVTSIEDGAFKDCTNLVNVTIPASVTNIGKKTFSGCSNLASVTIPTSVTSIGEQAFNECTSLTSVDIPDSVTSIGMLAFNGCTKLTNIKIPNGVTSIGSYAFNGCKNLSSVVIPNGVTCIDNGVFKYCESLTDINIPEGVTVIGEFAFCGCNSLTEIKIPDGVTKIEYSVFADCLLLMDVTIPDSVTRIEQSAFGGCIRLSSVTIPDNVTYIGHYAFRECTRLESVSIPGKVASIGEESFKGCTSLTSITIPVSVTSIGNLAFSKCDKLTTVRYGGTEAQWNNINRYSLIYTGLSNKTIQGKDSNGNDTTWITKY
ncbi:MAG: leucine-rich repeat protein [Treponemataceae bacterium]|nr:leucine-rich repeat protein [Treponemataceae bacterium]